MNELQYINFTVLFLIKLVCIGTCPIVATHKFSPMKILIRQVPYHKFVSISFLSETTYFNQKLSQKIYE